MKMVEKTTWLVAGRVVADLLSFAFYIAVARQFGEAGVGDYTFAFSVAAVVALGVEFGVRHLVTREVAREPTVAVEYAGNLVVLQAGLGFAFGALLLLLCLLLGYAPHLRFLILIAYTALAVRAMGISLVALLEAVEAMDRSAQIEVIGRAGIAVPGLLLIFFDYPLPVVMVAHLLGGISYLASAHRWVVGRFGTYSPQVDFSFMRRTLAAAIPFLGAAVLHELYARVDILMLHHLVGDVVTGRYAVSLRLVQAPVMLATLTGTAMYPTLARQSENSVESRNALFLETLRWLALLAAIGTTLFLAVGNDLIIFLFGAEFAEAGFLLQAMSVLFFLIFVKVPYWRLLFALDREQEVLKKQAASVAINIALNGLLIPSFGALGAVVASVVSEGYLLVVFHRAIAGVVSASYVGPLARIAFVVTSGAILGWSIQEALSWPLVAAAVIIFVVVAATLLRLILPQDYARIIRSAMAIFRGRDSRGPGTPLEGAE